MLLAARTGREEFAISEQEGKDFLTAAQRVMRHYNVETTQKTMDWIAFVGCGCMIYVPRVVSLAVSAHRAPVVAQPMPAPMQAANVDAPPGSPLETAMAGAFAMAAVQPEAAE